MRFKALLISALLCVQPFFWAGTARAEAPTLPDAPPAATPATSPGDTPPPWQTAQAPTTMATGTYYGHSGVDPYQVFSNLPSDEVFVADRGGKLDQYLCRSEGPITFNLDITRVYGAIARLSGQETYNNLQDAQTAIANGLLAKNATLYMRVYDVDHDYQGGDVAPEADLVSVNGHKLTRSLTSGNNRWDTVSYQVPVENFFFPAPAALGSSPKAPNEIRVDIDVNNSGDDVWCVEVDWAALHLQAARPAVLVNGILSNDHAWDNFRPLLWNLGLPNYAQELDATRGIFHNASDLADAMPNIKKAFGVDRINIVAHSKGGLDSRAYLRSHTDIDNLVQLATPNRGSDCAQAWLGNVLGSTYDLDPDWIHDNFNYRDTRTYFWQPHNWVPNWTELGRAPIYIFAATQFNTRKCPVGIGDDMDPPHDSVVSHDRATLPWNWTGVDGDGIDQGSTDAVGPYDHSSIHDSQAVAQQVVTWIAAKYGLNGAQANSAPAAAPASALTAAPAAATAATSERLVDDVGGLLAAGQQVTHTFLLEGGATSQVALIHGKSSTTARLTGPDGAALPASATNQPAGMNLATVYNLNAPAAGTYTLTVTAGAEDIYEVQVRTLGGMLLQATLSSEAVAPGTAVDVTAVLTDAAGNPVNGAAVTADLYKPDGAVQTVTLAEQSAGTYRGTVTGDTGGINFVVVRSIMGNAQRAATALLTVVPAGAALTAPTESTTDPNRDGLFDALVLNVGAQLPTAGLYVLSGDLYDQQGQLIQRQSVMIHAAAGAATFPLAFDGTTIYTHGVAGPYTLRDTVLVAVDQGGIPVATLESPYTTQAYAVAQFQHARLRLVGGSEQPLDTDGDGLYNYLRINLQIHAEVAGYYGLSGRLVTSTGEELQWSSSSAYINGDGTVILYFDGRQIRSGGANGPYRLVDLMIQGPRATVVPVAYTTAAYQFRQFQSIGADLTVAPEHITTDPAAPGPDQQVTLSALVENRGAAVTGTFQVAFYLGNPAQGGQLIGTTSVTGMAAESQQSVSVPWTTPAAGGSYEVYVVVNGNRAVPEYDYSNDTSFQVFTLALSDTVPPETTASLAPQPNDHGWLSSPVTVTLTATDDKSGVAATEYGLDGSGWLVYSGPVTVADQGIHDFTFRSIDVAGNPEAAKSVTLRIDLTPPRVAIDGVSDGQVSLLQPLTPQVAVSDNLDTAPSVAALLNDQPYAPGAPVTAFGTYELVVTATDAAGNSTTERITFTVADEPMYAAYLRSLVNQLADDVATGYPEANQNGLLAKLQGTGDKLLKAEEALRNDKPSAPGLLGAAANELDAFRNQLAAVATGEGQYQEWDARAEAIQTGIGALQATLK